MRTLTVCLTLLALACASQANQPQVVSPIAIVVESANSIQRLDHYEHEYNRIASQIHAQTIVTRLSDINESDFAAVLVLKAHSSMLTERDYDVTTNGRTGRTVMTVPYEVRRGGSVTRKGTLSLTWDGVMAGTSPLIGHMNTLLRDLS